MEATGDSDAIAVERTLAGDRDAFRVLVERHSPNVFRLAYRMTGNQYDAEEVVQEAFLRAYQKLSQFAARANDDGIEIDAMTFVPDSAPNPERLAQSEQLAEHMRRALQQLTPAERTAFVMRHWGGSGIEEIAEALKSSSSAAKNTIFRSVQKLRRALEPFVGPRGQARSVGTES